MILVVNFMWNWLPSCPGHEIVLQYFSKSMHINNQLYKIAPFIFSIILWHIHLYPIIVWDIVIFFFAEKYM